MGAVPYPLLPESPVVPSGWDGYHNILYPEYWSYIDQKLERYWCVHRFSVPVPLDQQVTYSHIELAIRLAFFLYIKSGAALRALLWYKDPHWLHDYPQGVWDYELYLEYVDHGIALSSLTSALRSGFSLAAVPLLIDLKLTESGTTRIEVPPVIPTYPDDGGDGTTPSSNMMPFILLGSAALVVIYAMRE